MDHNRQDQSTQTQPDAKDKHTEPGQLKRGEAKPRKRRLILYEWGFWVMVAVASIIFFVNHTLALVSIPLLFLGLILGAFALRLSLINHGSKHWRANVAWASIAFPCCLICGYVFWFEINDQKGKQDFSIHTTWSNFTMSPHYWFVYEPAPGHRRATPIIGGWLVEFTNLKPDPILIESYAVEQRGTNDQWIPVLLFKNSGPERGSFFYGETNNANEIKCRTFDDAIGNVDIGPKGTIRGWMFFKDIPPPQKDLRFEFRDVKTGLVSVGAFSMAFKQDFSSARNSLPVQPLMMEISTNELDIRTLPQW